MECTLCNLIQMSEKEEPFPSESARVDFMNQLAGDIALQHPELVKKILEKGGFFQELEDLVWPISCGRYMSLSNPSKERWNTFLEKWGGTHA